MEERRGVMRLGQRLVLPCWILDVDVAVVE